jgi:glycosyltransferase involved in cell wall biosynthesis
MNTSSLITGSELPYTTFMKVAFVADWLTVNAGAEHALVELHALWPDAPLYTTVARPERLGALGKNTIITTPLQRLYNMVGRHQLLLPFMPQAVEGIDLSGFDVIISSSHAVGKGIIPPSNSVHVCYCHTPMRYAWEMEKEYLRDFRVPKFLWKYLRRTLSKLRRWDLSTAKRVDAFIANSAETARRIQETYGRESVIIPPPVSKKFFEAPLGNAKRQGFLSVGRLVPYKRIDLLISAANALGAPLTIVGKGQEDARLRGLAGPTVKFLGFVSDHDLPALYASAEAVLFAAHEDAGIVPLEAQAMGTPVIAYGKGGVLDSVVEGKTGVFCNAQTAESFAEAMQTFQTMTFDYEAIREHARKFSAEFFGNRVRATVEGILEASGRNA